MISISIRKLKIDEIYHVGYLSFHWYSTSLLQASLVIFWISHHLHWNLAENCNEMMVQNLLRSVPLYLVVLSSSLINLMLSKWTVVELLEEIYFYVLLVMYSFEKYVDQLCNNYPYMILMVELNVIEHDMFPNRNLSKTQHRMKFGQLNSMHRMQY